MEGNTRTIDLGAIRENVRALRAQTPPSAALMAVVKADAYGHGACEVARAALAAGASALAVARVDEGAELRSGGIGAPVLVLGLCAPGEMREAAELGLTLTVCSPEIVSDMARAAAESQRPLRCHLKLDTGMGRIGCRSEREVRQTLDAIECAQGVKLTGVYSHLADADGEGLAQTEEQLSRFARMLPLLPGGICRHIANSAAIHRLMPGAAYDMVRMGISLYGYPPVETDAALRPAMRWEAPVTYVKTIAAGESVSYGCTWRATRESRIATVAVGYGDGYHRCMSGKAQALIHGRRAPVVGRICMDQMMLDVTDAPQTRPGDTVTLLGRDGDEMITAEDLAAWAGTISYELLLSATGRVRKVWVNG